MAYPVTLVDIASMALAAACLRSTWPDLKGEPRKLYLVAVPPVLGVVTAMLLLASAVESFAHDATWVATTLIGSIAGLWRGRRVMVQIDQVWGAVRTSPAFDTVFASALILIIAVLDGTSGLFAPGTLPRHAHFAAGCALFAGYLAGRAYSLITRAMGLPHSDIDTPSHPPKA